ncbi:fasciclin domain-containing protein [Thalassobellus sediminis]|uniref:fasciclin domain-containing protein n=1 Tax=Thalassobellus sediminis TaxID=3367753 RepID=UPI003789E6E8
MKNLFKNRRPNLFNLPIIVLVVAFLTFSCNNEDVETINLEATTPSIVEVLANFNTESISTSPISKSKSDKYSNAEPTFEILSVALAKTKLASTVSKNRLTVFAPTDKAFMDAGITKKNVASIPGIKDILLYHVLGGPVFSSKLVSGPVPTVQGKDVIININDSGVSVNSSNVIMADISARNGVIHVIDKVLSIPTLNLVELALSKDPEFSILVQAVLKAELAETLAAGGPYTVLAPTNQAFLDLLTATPYNSLDEIPKDFLTQILLYHVVDGYAFSNQLSNGFVPTLNGAAVNVNLDSAPMVYINDSKVIITDVQATNGVIHAIDKVLLPPTMNLVETAGSYNPEFSVLLAAATKAGLAGVLMGEEPTLDQLTVFAPTNQAFINLLEVADTDAAIAAVESMSVESLTNILLYHVVKTRVYSSDLTSGKVTTLNGDFNLDLNNLTINGSAMLVPDLLNVQATNGVIHVISSVLIP